MKPRLELEVAPKTEYSSMVGSFYVKTDEDLIHLSERNDYGETNLSMTIKEARQIVLMLNKAISEASNEEASYLHLVPVE